MITSTLISNSHILLTAAAIVLVITIVWRLTTKCRSGKRNLITRALLVAVLTTVGIGIYPILSKKKITRSDAKKSDIEKTGGTILICKITPMRNENGESIADSPSSVERVVKTIENRLSALKLKGFKAEARESDKIRIELPGISPETLPQVREALTHTAKLEIKEVHPNTRMLSKALVAEKEDERILPPGYELNYTEYQADDGKIIREDLLLKRLNALDGSYILHAQELYGPHEGKLTIELNSAGAEKMFNLTSNMQHGVDRLAILLNGKVLSAPVVQDSLGARFEISGLEDAAAAKKLAIAFLNPLVQPLVILEERTVSAELALKSAQKP